MTTTRESLMQPAAIVLAVLCLGAGPAEPNPGRALILASKVQNGAVWPGDRVVHGPWEWRHAGTALMKCAQGLWGWDLNIPRPPEKNWPEFQLRVMRDFRSFYIFGDPYHGKVPLAPSGTIFPAVGPPKEVRIAERKWASMRIRYHYGKAGVMDTVVSRLSPAALVESDSAKTIHFFGDLLFDIIPKGAKDVQPTPRFVAIPTAEGIKVFSGPGVFEIGKHMTEGWALVWFGRNSYISSTRLPVQQQYHWSNQTWPKKQLAHYDCPWLFVFGRKPRSATLHEPVNLKFPREPDPSDPPAGATFRYWEQRISRKNRQTGRRKGLTFAFGESGGQVAMMPLHGNRYTLMSETEQWGQEGLPKRVVADCRKWSSILRHFPVNVTESYSLDDDLATLTVRGKVEFRELGNPFGEKAPKVAPFPPMLALAAKAGFLETAKPIVDLDCPATAGPVCGVYGADEYVFTVTGLDRYLWQRPQTQPTPAAAKLAERMQTHVQAMLEAGVMAPVLFQPTRVSPTPWARFGNIGELTTTLEMVRPFVPVAMGPKLDDYLRRQRQVSPFGSGLAPYWQGARREAHEYPESVRKRLQAQEPAFWPQDFYALGTWWARYGKLAGRKLNTALPQALTSREDWALGPLELPPPTKDVHWVMGYTGHLNAFLQQMLGCARIAYHMRSRDLVDLAAYRFARAAAHRIGIERLPAYLYESKQIAIPKGMTNWAETMVRRNANGLMMPDRWQGPDDDVRSVTVYDANGAELFPLLRDRSHSTLFHPYHFLVPETGRLFRDYIQTPCRRKYERLEQRLPSWWLTRGPKVDYVRSEATYSPPDNAWQMFLLAGWVLELPADDLACRLDVPFCPGDLYHLQKLAIAAGAYGETEWHDIRKDAR